MEIRRRLAKSDWIEAVRMFEGSGLTLKSFAEQRALSVHSLQYWRRKLVGSQGIGAVSVNGVGFSRVRFASELSSVPRSENVVRLKIEGGRLSLGSSEWPSPDWLVELGRCLSR